MNNQQGSTKTDAASNNMEGAATNAFMKAAHKEMAPVTGAASFRIGEDGRLYFSAMIEKTKACLEEGTPVLCEASFTWYGNFCAADILKKEGEGYVLYEVKNAYSVRKEFVTDLGFQRFLLRKCGVKVIACKLILRGDTPPEGYAYQEEPFSNEEFLEHNGFTYRIVDVTKGAREADKLASDRIFELGKLKRKDMPMPDISPDEHCLTPYRCWYYDFCHKE